VLTALGIGPGDEVVVPSFSFAATANAVVLAGAAPVFADIEPEGYNLDPEQVKRKITRKTRAIMPVHLYGQPASLAPLKALAEEHNLFLVEDSAQAHGAQYQGKPVGGHGHASGFSFYPGKNLGAFGDAGGITTNDEALASKIRMLADHGRTTKYEHALIGCNSRLDALQAAVLDVKLRHLAEWNQQRAKWAAFYTKALAGVGDLALPKTLSDRTHVFHQYVVQSDRRDALLKHLHAAGIMAGLHYPVPLHLQPAYQHLNHQAGDFPISEGLANRCLSLPMFAELTESEAERIVEPVQQFFGK